MINFKNFYRKYGVRLIPNLINPKMNPLDSLSLPLDSTYHFCDLDLVTDGPINNDILFKDNTKPIQVQHVTELNVGIGSPKKISYMPEAEIRQYHRLNKRTKWARNIDSVSRDKMSIIVYNYTLALKSVKYVKSFFSNYYKWYNVFSTMIDNIASLTQSSNRNNFIISKAPKVIPSLQQLNLASTKDMNQALVNVFRDEDSLLLLELWKWLSEDEEIYNKSLFSKIAVEKLHLVNIIFIESDMWTVLNLGYLFSFCERSSKYKNLPIVSKSTVGFVQLQKRLLRFEIAIMEVRTVVAAQDTGVDLEKVKELDRVKQQELEDEVSDDSSSEKVDKAAAQTLQADLDLDLAEDDGDDEDPTPQESEEIKAQRLKQEDDLLDEELSLLNEISQKQAEDASEPTQSLSDILSNQRVPTPEESIMSVCDKLADDGLISAAEYKRTSRLSTAYKDIIGPNGKPLAESSKIEEKDLLIPESSTLPDKPTVLDKTMLKSTLIDFDSKYIGSILPKDTVNMVLNIQHAGVAVTDYKVETVKDIQGAYETHIVKLQPVIGKQSTIRFKLPVIEKNGEFTSNGIKYRLRKQRGDLPIRKISPDQVALTSYYGKVFVVRGRKKVSDYGRWLTSQIMAIVLDPEDNTITDVLNSNVFNKDATTPRAYSAISETIKSITCRGYNLSFDYSKRQELYGKEVVKQLEKRTSIIFGINKRGDHLLLDHNNTVYIARGENLEVFGSLEQFLNISLLSAPVEYAEMSVFGKEVPVGIILSYFIGFEKLLKTLKLKPRRIEGNSRFTLEQHEWSIQFNDETLIFSREDRLASMILGGFNSFKKIIKQYSIYTFDKKGVYLNILETNGLSASYLREINLMNKLFIDTITRDILIEMNEPVTFQGLLIRSCQLLLNDRHPDQLDPKFMRIKGYERLSGAVYSELVQSMRRHEGRLGKANHPVEMHPYAVWKRITEDTSKAQVNEINPIESLKETEAVTFSGTGGRNKRSMTKITRAFHRNDMGTISESTVDSSDVGINIFTSADPMFRSLRGTSGRYEIGKSGVTSLLSTSALLSPGSNHDDPKRVNFVGIQSSHSIATQGYHQFTVRTGYDSVVADRTYDLFAMTAKKPGEVTSIVEKGIIITYNDGEVTGYELGRRFGNSAGLVIPHEIVTQLRVGDKVKEGDAIVYNSGFFEPDFFDNKRLALKNSINVKTVLWESYQTLEDASAVSERVSGFLTTKTTKVKNIIVAFDQSISNLLKVGDEVKADSILCILEDSVTSNNNLFSEDSIDTLKLISANSPKANVKGVIEKIEVFYHGDKQDMSESLRQIANYSDRQLAAKAKATNTPVMTGSVDGGLRIENEPLNLDTMAIRVYITSDIDATIGDKGVFANQMKTVFSEINEQDYITEDGQTIDAIFGGQSIGDRIVQSPYVIGTTNSLLEVIAKEAVKAYREG